MTPAHVLYVLVFVGLIGLHGCGSDEGELHPPWPPIEEGGVGPGAAYQLGGATAPTQLGGGPEAYRKDVDARSDVSSPEPDVVQSTD